LLVQSGAVRAEDTEPKPDKPNVLVIWGDDIGTWNISHNNRGMMGYRTPNIDRIAQEGLSFTDYYGQLAAQLEHLQRLVHPAGVCDRAAAGDRRQVPEDHGGVPAQSDTRLVQPGQGAEAYRKRGQRPIVVARAT
jgi:hypothetical protein